MSKNKNKNCSELLLTNGIGLDRAPFKVQLFDFVFWGPPIGQSLMKGRSCSAANDFVQTESAVYHLGCILTNEFAK